jgi:hypothetical protein
MWLIPMILAPSMLLGHQTPQATASLAGCISDPLGYRIPGVTIVAKADGSQRTVDADTSGCYEVKNLKPGSYRVTFRLAGFDNVTRDRVILEAGNVARFDSTMRISPICECVRVPTPRTLAEAWKGADGRSGADVPPGNNSSNTAIMCQ